MTKRQQRLDATVRSPTWRHGMVVHRRHGQEPNARPGATVGRPTPEPQKSYAARRRDIRACSAGISPAGTGLAKWKPWP